MRLYKVTIREREENALHTVWTTLNLLAEGLEESIELAKKRLEREYEHPGNFEVTDATIIAYIDAVVDGEGR